MITVTAFGKVSNAWRNDYIRRLQRMTSFEWRDIPLTPSPNERTTQLLKEEKRFLEGVENFFILDPTGELFSFPQWQKLVLNTRPLHFVVGPAVGLHSEFRKKARKSISLTPVTLTHELSQTMLAEILYRIFCGEMNHPFVK